MITDGRTLERLTVRAVVPVATSCCWFTPGSTAIRCSPVAVLKRESHHVALARELLEECGAELMEVGALLGETREYRAARESGFNAYCIRSLYYLCRIGDQLVAPQPQPYEIRLGFVPGWFALDEALQTNKTQLAGPCPNGQRGRPWCWPSCNAGISRDLRPRLLSTSSRNGQGYQQKERQ